MVNKNGVLSVELINGLLQQAEMMVFYKNALTKNGMTEADALRMTIAYQGQQVEAAYKANIEEKKAALSLMDNGKVMN